MTVTATVTGRAHPLPDDMQVRWIAASPPDRRTSFSGSGLPFASQEQAFHAPQSGVRPVDPSGKFVIELEAPNSFHVGSSEHPVPPQVVVEWVVRGRSHTRTLSVAAATEPSRSLRKPCFDEESAFADVMGQEAYLNSGRYTPPEGRSFLDFLP